MVCGASDSLELVKNLLGVSPSKSLGDVEHPVGFASLELEGGAHLISACLDSRLLVGDVSHELLLKLGTTGDTLRTLVHLRHLSLWLGTSPWLLEGLVFVTVILFIKFFFLTTAALFLFHLKSLESDKLVKILAES